MSDYAMTPEMADRLAEKLDGSCWDYWRVGDIVGIGSPYMETEYRADLKDIEQVAEFLRVYFNLERR